MPLVGATIGACAGSVGFAASRVAPRPLGAALALGTSLALSGAIHLDGFLDGCDAFFASVPPQRRREILKDPRHGTYALAGFAVVGSIWFAALDALPARALPGSLAFAGALARAAVVPCAVACPATRDARQPPRFALREAAVPLALQTVVLAFAGGRIWRRAGLLVPLAFLAAVAILRWCAGRLGGGLTGDAYGFTIVLIEVALVAILAARAA